jgi:hypothetical protein
MEKATGRDMEHEKVLHMVVSLDGVVGADEENTGRLARFRGNWEKECGTQISFDVCPGNLSPITGVGLTLSYMTCLQRAFNTGADAVFLYEDDALLFDRSFCSRGFQGKLLSATPKDNLVLLLGGHDFVIDRSENPARSPFVKLIQSYGTYGFAVKRSNMLSLATLFERQVEECIADKRKCSPDVSWYHLANSMSKVIHAVNPLLVDHAKGTWSNTWKKLRSSSQTGELWMGKRNVYEMMNPHPNLNIK